MPRRAGAAGRQVDLEEIEKARPGAPALAAAGAVALAPEHVGLGHALHMAAAVLIKPVIRPPRRAGPEALPAEAPGLGRLARGVAGLAAQPGLAARDPRDQFELAAQDVAAGGAELAVGAMVRIGAEEGDACLRRQRGAPRGKAMRAERLAAHQHEELRGEVAPAGLAAQQQVITVPDPGEDAKALGGGGRLPMRPDRGGKAGQGGGARRFGVGGRGGAHEKILPFVRGCVGSGLRAAWPGTAAGSGKGDGSGAVSGDHARGAARPFGGERAAESAGQAAAAPGRSRGAGEGLRAMSAGWGRGWVQLWRGAPSCGPITAAGTSASPPLSSTSGA